MSLKEKLLEILPNGKYLQVSALTNGFELKYGAQYRSPALSFSQLVVLSELFGTKEIDVDKYSQSGCESCDWGSDYGHTIQIYNPIENVWELKELIGKDLKKDG